MFQDFVTLAYELLAIVKDFSNTLLGTLSMRVNFNWLQDNVIVDAIRDLLNIPFDPTPTDLSMTLFTLIFGVGISIYVFIIIIKWVINIIPFA